jgi:FtsZ-binding cell division protein ZapB
MADGKITVEVSTQAAQAELQRLRDQNATLKRDLVYARDGLTKGRTRMRQDIERLQAENAALKREAHTWSKAAEHYAKPPQPLDPLDVEELWDEAHTQWNQAKGDHADVHEMFARLIERKHGIGA